MKIGETKEELGAGKKMTKEVAEKMFLDFAEQNDIDTDTAAMNEEEQATFAQTKRVIVRAFEDGRLIVGDDGNLRYTISDKSPAGYAGKQLEITPPTGAMYMKLDNYKKEQAMHRIVSLMSAMCGEDLKFFSFLNHKDYKVLQAVVVFFITD